MPVWIVNEDLVNLTIDAAESLKGELIIIDNGSPMGGGVMRELAHTYIRNKENLGYARAVNQGLKLCKNETVAIANNDIKVSANWEDVANNILENKLVGSVHFRMIPYTQAFNPGNDIWIGGKERWCTSSFFVVRNRILYDENYLNTYDDWDYWKRFRKLYKQAYTNKAEYQHVNSYTQQFVAKRSENDTKNREYFKKKHGGYPEDLFEKEFPGQLSQPWLPQP